VPEASSKGWDAKFTIITEETGIQFSVLRLKIAF
jgi:hypothetical protein